MKTRSVVAALSLAALCTAAYAQDKPKEAPAMPSQAEMEAMMRAGTPGEPHKIVARMAGDWTYVSHAWMAPGQPPVESKGTMRGQAIMGGRYVEQVWNGDFMGMPFEGRSTSGYDNVNKKYFSTWVDSMSTAIQLSTGTCDDNGNKCTYTGEMTDPMTNKPMTMRSVITWSGDNAFTNEMFAPGPDGKEYKMMELTVKKK